MNFGDALELLKGNWFVSRQGWNGKNYLGLQKPDANSMNTLPYIYMITVTGDRVPWLASQSLRLQRQSDTRIGVEKWGS